MQEEGVTGGGKHQQRQQDVHTEVPKRAFFEPQPTQETQANDTQSVRASHAPTLTDLLFKSTTKLGCFAVTTTKAQHCKKKKEEEVEEKKKKNKKNKKKKNKKKKKKNTKKKHVIMRRSRRRMTIRS